MNDKNQRILELCQHVGADVYLSGQGARSYNDEPLFNSKGISIVYQEYQHPVYDQINGPFVSNLSVVDALFNLGFESTRALIKG